MEFSVPFNLCLKLRKNLEKTSKVCERGQSRSCGTGRKKPTVMRFRGKVPGSAEEIEGARRVAAGNAGF